jgi:hypothetical protein
MQTSIDDEPGIFLPANRNLFRFVGKKINTAPAFFCSEPLNARSRTLNVRSRTLDVRSRTLDVRPKPLNKKKALRRKNFLP